MPALPEWLRLALFCTRLDARRPASWLMLAAAVLAAGGADGMVALGVGALLAVGAIGDLPLAACAPLGRGSPAALVWLVERAAWPVVGLAVGAVAIRPSCSAAVGPWAALAGIAAASLTLFLVRRRGAPTADAASLTLVFAGLAAAASATATAHGAAWQGWPVEVAAVVWAMAAWAAAAATALVIEWRSRAASTWLPEAGPPRTLRLWLTAIAMASALAAMVGWLFLDPSRSRLLPILAAGWFVALAVPEATFGTGVADDAGWRRLWRSAAGGAPWWPGGVGHVRHALATAATTAAILGWPAVVAALLGGGSTAGIQAAALTALLLAAAVVVLMAVVSSCAVAGASAETTQSVAFTFFAAIVLPVAVGVAASRPLGPGRPAAQNAPLAVNAGAH
jgi:hypothetical protein